MYDDGNKFLAILALFDLSIFVEVYKAHDDDDNNEPTEEMRTIQLAEAVLESVPQSLLQSVFVMRTFIANKNDNNLKSQDTLLLLFSVIASIVSIATKYITVDSTPFVNNNGGAYASEESEKANFCSKKNKCFFINFGYFVRSLWRIGSVTARVLIYSLVWAVMGGAFFICYLIIEILLCTFFVGFVDKKFEKKEQFLFIIVAMVSIYFEDWNTRIFFYVRLIDDILVLSIIFLFSFYSFKCDPVCSDSENRNIDKNIAVKTYIIISAISIVIYSISIVVGAIFKNYIVNVWEDDEGFCGSVKQCLSQVSVSNLKG